MTSLSTQGYKGTRDYLPNEKRLQNYIFNKWRKVVESYGYEEYGTPMVEPIELYQAKSGQELASEQTYLFEDRGGRQVAIRPEMTPSLARMVASKRQEMAFPARLYSIANFMRYERPQRGREREFWQLNADLFGVDGVAADAEIIELSHRCLIEFGASQQSFTVRINHRQLVDKLMADFLGLDIIGGSMMARLLDKLHKLPPDDFRQQAIEIFGEDAKVGLEKLIQLISMKSLDELPGSLALSQPVLELRQLADTLKAQGIVNFKIDFTLMRGLDYYTGIVFEFFDNHPDNNRALFGGGRYDGLVSLFGAEPLPTVGVGLGATTMQDFLEVHNLMPKLKTHTDVFVAVLDSKLLDDARRLASKLREDGVKVELDITCRKLDKQIKTASKKQIPFVVFVGEDEVRDQVYPVKNLLTSEEQRVDMSRIVSVVKDYRFDGSDDAEFQF